MASSWGSSKHSLAFPSRRRRRRRQRAAIGEGWALSLRPLASTCTLLRDLLSTPHPLAPLSDSPPPLSSPPRGPPTVSHPYELKPDLMGWKRAARSSCIQLSLLSVPPPSSSPNGPPATLPGLSTECLARKFSPFLHALSIPRIGLLWTRRTYSLPADRRARLMSISEGDKDPFNPPDSPDPNHGACRAVK